MQCYKYFSKAEYGKLWQEQAIRAIDTIFLYCKTCSFKGNRKNWSDPSFIRNCKALVNMKPKVLINLNIKNVCKNQVSLTSKRSSIGTGQTAWIIILTIWGKEKESYYTELREVG